MQLDADKNVVGLWGKNVDGKEEAQARKQVNATVKVKHPKNIILVSDWFILVYFTYCIIPFDFIYFIEII